MATIKQRKKSFSVIYWYLDNTGERKQKWDTLGTRKEAKQRKAFVEYYQEKFGYVIVPLEEQFAQQIEDSKKELEVVNEDITFRDFLKIFVNLYGTSKWSPNTFSSKVGSIRNYINPYIGDWKLNEITTKKLSKYYNDLLSVPEVPQSNRKPSGRCVQPANIKKIHDIIRCALNQAIRWEYFDPTQKPHCTTRLVLKTPKTETSNRTVWLPKTVAKLLVQYKKDQQELKEFLGNAYNDYNLVIALENGNPVESRIVRDRFQKLCEENDFEIVVFHSLRHLSTGYKLKMTNGDVKSVQGDTGHAEAEMVTDVYSEIIHEDRRFNAQKMDKEFYSNLNDEEEKSETETSVSDSDKMLLELLKSLSPEMKEQLLKQTLQNQSNG